MNIKNPDLTTPGQKMVAVGIIGAILVGLYFVLPPLVTILKNVWLMIALGAPLAAGILFYETIWEETKRVAWNFTKHMISKDPLWHMWRGHEYLVKKNEALNEDIRNIGTIRIQNERILAQTVKDLKLEKENAIMKEGKVPASVIKVIRNKVALLDNQFQIMSPKLDMVKKQEADLIVVYENRVADTEIVKQTLEAKAQEYEMMKSLASASANASAWLKDSSQMKNFKQSLKEIEYQISDFTSTVEDFQRNIVPMITASASSGVESEGAALIEEYKKQRLALAA